MNQSRLFFEFNTENIILALPNQKNMVTPFISYCKANHTLSPKFIKLIRSDAYILEVSRHQDLTQILQDTDSTFFLSSGLIRKYIEHQGKDITLDFLSEDNLLDSDLFKYQYLEGQELRLRALEDSRLIVMPHALINKLLRHCPESGFILKTLMTRKIYQLNEQAALSRIPDASSRYQIFCSLFSNPKRIPGKYLASYLGMRQETLSRIKASTELN
ncbi:Crp/Fnr family transcriptional regulator [Pedobacter agri]|uniref:Crp/Fnr family transcriptional regulator n=1 Tax=Pedobacter agri TaxID=454586 RepID=UPI00292EE505|nr:Crp/Fnr family transcriptional regulator [Pedobacter agri]